MLTTIDLPVVSHVTRASAREPFLGMMLTLDVRSVVQIASELDVARPRGDDAYRSISFEPLEPALLEALVRLVRLLDEPTLAPRLAPLIQQEIVIRLLTGPHGPQLLHLVTAGSPSQQIAKSVAWLKQNFAEPLRIDDVADRAHMSPSTFRQHFRALTGVSPLAVPEAVATSGSTTVDAERAPRRRQRSRARWLREPITVQPGIQPAVWRASAARCDSDAGRPGGRRGAWGAGRKSGHSDVIIETRARCRCRAIRVGSAMGGSPSPRPVVAQGERDSGPVSFLADEHSRGGAGSRRNG